MEEAKPKKKERYADILRGKEALVRRKTILSMNGSSKEQKALLERSRNAILPVLNEESSRNYQVSVGGDSLDSVRDRTYITRHKGTSPVTSPF